MGSRVAALLYQAQAPGTELRVHCGLPVWMSSAPHQLEAPAVPCRGLGSVPTGREVSLEYSYIPEPSALVPAGLLGPLACALHRLPLQTPLSENHPQLSISLYKLAACGTLDLPVIILICKLNLQTASFTVWY